jgi:hypothetical protein
VGKTPVGAGAVGGGAVPPPPRRGRRGAAEARGPGPDGVRSRSDAPGALDRESGRDKLPGPTSCAASGGTIELHGPRGHERAHRQPPESARCSPSFSAGVVAWSTVDIPLPTAPGTA